MPEGKAGTDRYSNTPPARTYPASPDPSMWQPEKISVDDDDLGAPSVENTAAG